ncbi:hypothetical protein CR513_27794, partial [Mucuna pruriens]
MVKLRLPIESYPNFLDVLCGSQLYCTPPHPFELVCGFNPLTPLDLLSLPNVNAIHNSNGVSKAQFTKELHTKVCSHIEKKVEQYAFKVFKESDLVWVHLWNETFPNLRKSKILPRGNGPFKGSHTLHVIDFSSFSSTLNLNLKANSFKEGEPNKDLTKKIIRTNASKAKDAPKLRGLKSKPKPNHILCMGFLLNSLEAC